MQTSQTLSIIKIKIDQEVQPRSELNEAVTTEYSEAMKKGAIFPPIIVYFDGSEFWLADGFHRVKAKDSIGGRKIFAEVRCGSRRDAMLFAVGANALHGLQRTNADKRRSVERLLRDPEWSLWSNCEIAKQCQVDEKTVRRAKKKLTQTKQPTCTSQCLVRRNGKVQQMNVSKIGSKTTGNKHISNFSKTTQQTNSNKNFSQQSISSAQSERLQALYSKQIRILNIEIVTSEISDKQHEVYSRILTEGPVKAWSIILTQMQAHPDFADNVWQLAQNLMTHTN